MSSRSATSSPIRCRALAAQTGLVLDMHHDLDPGQVNRQRSAVGPAGPGTRGATVWIIRLDAGGVLGLAPLDLLQRQVQLVDGQGLGASSEAVALELLDDLRQPLHLGRECRALAEQRRLKGRGIVRKGSGQHRHRPRRTAYSVGAERPHLAAALVFRRTLLWPEGNSHMNRRC